MIAYFNRSLPFSCYAKFNFPVFAKELFPAVIWEGKPVISRFNFLLLSFRSLFSRLFYEVDWQIILW